MLWYVVQDMLLHPVSLWGTTAYGLLLLCTQGRWPTARLACHGDSDCYSASQWMLTDQRLVRLLSMLVLGPEALQPLDNLHKAPAAWRLHVLLQGKTVHCRTWLSRADVFSETYTAAAQTSDMQPREGMNNSRTQRASLPWWARQMSFAYSQEH